MMDHVQTAHRTRVDGNIEIPWQRASVLYAQVALGTAFLSAVASRFGLWERTLDLKHFANFIQYAGEVNSFLPRSVIPVIAWAATVAETSLGILLIMGLWPRWVSLASALLLAIFGTAMAISFGLKSPMDYSVFSASSAALLLAVQAFREQTKLRLTSATMNRNRTIAALTTLLICVCLNVSSALAQQRSDDDLLRSREAVWRAWFAGDTKTLQQLVPAETIVMSGGEENWKKQADVLRTSVEFHAKGGKLLRLEFPRTEIQHFGDVAIVWSSYVLELEVEGKRSSGSSRVTEIFVWKDGRWTNPGWHTDPER